MDLLTLAQAKKYTDSQRIGYEEVKSVTIDSAQDAEIPFNSPIGLHVIDFTPGRLMLTTPNRKPDISQIDGADNNICEGDMLFVGYHTFNGLLDTPALFVTCPSLGGYDFQQGWAFVYAFETTSDTMGMGLTITKGWYAISSNTFTIVPIDLATHPVSVHPDIIGEGIKPGCEEYMSDLFPLRERYEYVVTKDNLLDIGNGNYFVTLANMENGEENVFFAWVTPGFNWHSDSSVDNSLSSASTFTISWTEVHKIDPKFIPGRVVIDLDAYGIDLAALVTSGGGVSTVYGADDIWDKIKGADIVVFQTMFGSTEFRLIPTAKSATQVGFNLVADSYDNMIVANISMQRRMDDSGEYYIRIRTVVTIYPPT